MIYLSHQCPFVDPYVPPSVSSDISDVAEVCKFVNYGMVVRNCRWLEFKGIIETHVKVIRTLKAI